MSNMALDVKVFIEACDQKPSQENAHLYRTLIAEEYDEFCQSLIMRDDVEQLDACMDMIWVILGYCYMKNFQVLGAWEEVARSNLSKIDKKTGKVIKREDGKVLKPEGWKPPNLGSYVNKKLVF
jgi:predicted HAD superfamily Cof-like phosphohydrolase